MENNEEIEIVKVDNPEVIYQQDKATIDMQISTAKAYPRNIKRSVDNAIAIVTLDKETAGMCTYALPRGGKNISGPSVHLAKILAQSWGNLRCEAKVISIESKHITSQAITFDLENNLAIKVEVKRSIMTKTGRMNDDMITVTGNAANSIALRNSILSVIPRNIVDKVYASAKQTITGNISSKNQLIAKRKEILDALKDAYGVSNEEVIKAIGRASVDLITSDDIVVLIGIAQAIKDGDTTIENAFRPIKDSIKKSVDDKEKQRVINHIENSKSIPELEQVRTLVSEHQLELEYEMKLSQLTTNQ